MNIHNTTIDQAKEQEKLKAEKEYHRQWRLKNKEKLKQQNKEYYQNNKQRVNELNKKWKKQNAVKHKEYLVEYNSKNREHIKEYHKSYREQNSERIREYCKKHKEKNKERYKEQRRQHYLKNREQIREQDKAYYQQNKERIKESAREYQKKNRESINKKTVLKLKTNKQYKLRCVLSTRIATAIKSGKGTKTVSTIELLGCTIDHARRHIESLWQPEMTWENYSLKGWHIDHIKPCAAFDLTDPEQQKQCFHYTNLQPLWSKVNRSKSSAYNGIMHYYKKS
ncbi:hypothetical protein UFOVP760_38 [uncultured Caudovirales phage]|uniref:Uncharacterized protein n=1 Tax=uncultured Caudovirales phage TaxID=2100421 RepID=A0A6J7X6M4_9CAUD|nr:hypothetical protein UFOVP760_38 [uncultured Caudovirales phage]